MPSQKKQECVLICQVWEESESGWGTRPDGYSLHLTDDDRKAFIKEYWDGMPKMVPDEYSRPVSMGSHPYACFADKKTFKEVQKSKNGVRYYSNNLPPRIC